MQKDKRPIIFSSIGLLAVLYIIFSGPIFMGNIPFLLVQTFGILLIVWALIAKKLQEKDKHKLPRGYFLVTHGPYEIIRHPIYAGFLLIMCAYVQGYSSISRSLVFFLLLGMAVLKIIHDEGVMEKYIPNYKNLQKKTQKIIPYLY